MHIQDNFNLSSIGQQKGAFPEYKRMVLDASQYTIPRFEHNYDICVDRQDYGDYILCCSCPMFSKMQHSCRHMYVLLRRSPIITDVSIRWRVGYRNDYGRSTEMLQQYMYIWDNFDLPGIVISIEEVERLKHDLYAPGHGDRDVTFFERRHNCLYLQGAVTYWKKKWHNFHRTFNNKN